MSGSPRIPSGGSLTNPDSSNGNLLGNTATAFSGSFGGANITETLNTSTISVTQAESMIVISGVVAMTGTVNGTVLRIKEGGDVLASVTPTSGNNSGNKKSIPTILTFVVVNASIGDHTYTVEVTETLGAHGGLAISAQLIELDSS